MHIKAGLQTKVMVTSVEFLARLRGRFASISVQVDSVGFWLYLQPSNLKYNADPRAESIRFAFLNTGKANFFVYIGDRHQIGQGSIDTEYWIDSNIVQSSYNPQQYPQHAPPPAWTPPPEQRRYTPPSWNTTEPPPPTYSNTGNYTRPSWGQREGPWQAMMRSQLTARTLHTLERLCAHLAGAATLPGSDVIL
jgi:hypothetical protein